MRVRRVMPTSDRVAVRQLPPEAYSPAGLVIPDPAKEAPLLGRVEAVGPGRVTELGNVVEMNLEVGDLVAFGQYSGTPLTIDGRTLLLLSERDVIAVVEEGEE